MAEVEKNVLLYSRSERRKMFREESRRRNRLHLCDRSMLKTILLKAAYKHIGEYPDVEDSVPAIGVSLGGYSRFTGKDVTVTACFCYKMGELRWEIVEGPLRRRLRIYWDCITGLELKLNECGLACLTVETNVNPGYQKYSLESNIWSGIEDFTDEEKWLNFPPHHVLFKPGAVDESYEKLLNCKKEIALLREKHQQRFQKKLRRKHRKLSTSKSEKEENK